MSEVLDLLKTLDALAGPQGGMPRKADLHTLAEIVAKQDAQIQELQTTVATQHTHITQLADIVRSQQSDSWIAGVAWILIPVLIVAVAVLVWQRARYRAELQRLRSIVQDDGTVLSVVAGEDHQTIMYLTLAQLRDLARVIGKPVRVDHLEPAQQL